MNILDDLDVVEHPVSEIQEALKFREGLGYHWMRTKKIVPVEARVRSDALCGPIAKACKAYDETNEAKHLASEAEARYVDALEELRAAMTMVAASAPTKSSEKSLGVVKEVSATRADALRRLAER